MEEERLKKEKASKKKKKKSDSSINLLGVDLFDLIKNFLDCKVRIEKIYIVYEDNLDFIQSKKNFDLKRFNFNIFLEEFEFKIDDIVKHCNKDGLFKSFMNINTFLQKSGTWQTSKSAYWNM